MRADNERSAAVAEMAHRHFLRRGFGVHVHHDGIRRFAERTCVELRIDGCKRIVLRFHEDAAERRDDEHILPVPRLKQIRALARRAGGKIARAQYAVFIVDEGQYLALVGPVVAGGDAIDAQREEIVGDGAREAKAARRVLAVDDHKIQFQPVDETRQFRGHDIATGFSNDVSDEKNAHIQP